MNWGVVVSFLEKAAIIVLFAYVLFRVPLLRPFAEQRTSSRRAKILLGVVFGLFSIYGTLSGLPVLGGVINIRDMGPMIAGLVGGVVPGVVAGTMGGTQRLLMGIADWEAYGLTAIPCALSTLLIGLAAGLIYRRRGLLRPLHAGLGGALLEAGHIMLAVVFAGHPTEMLRLSTIQTAWIEVGRPAALPMILANSLGVAMFMAVFGLYRRELSTFRERNRYYKEVEQRNLELRSVFHISQSMNASSIDLATTLCSITTHVQEMLAASGVRLYLCSPSTQQLELGDQRGVFASSDASSSTLPSDAVRWIWEHRQGLLLEEATTSPLTVCAVGNERDSAYFGSLVGAPLFFGDRCVGVLEVLAKQKNAFDAHSLRLLETIAPQAAVAAHNARQVEARETALRRTIEELQIQIDETEKQRQVEEITETDYFQSLRRQADRLRNTSYDADTSS